MTPPLCPLCGMPYECVMTKRKVDSGSHEVVWSNLVYIHVGGRECEDWDPVWLG